MYATLYDLGIKSSIKAEFWAVQEGLKLCIDQIWLPVTLEINSLLVYNYVIGIWESLWSFNLIVHKINGLRRDKEVELQYI